MLDDFWDSAVCKTEQVPTGIFFGSEDESPQERTIRIAMAKSICQRCYVADECLQMAIANDERGIWGGKTENERYRGSTVLISDPLVPVVPSEPVARSIWVTIADSNGVVLQMTRRFTPMTWQIVVDGTVRYEKYVEGEAWIVWNRAVESRMRY